MGPLAPETVFAKEFRVVRPLSEGGMGAVYVAEQLATGHLRALKLMHLSLGEDAKRRFAQEARIGSQIASEHVVQVVAAGVDDQTQLPWLAMELLEGRDLEARVREGGPLSLGELLVVFAQLAHAIGNAHRSDIVHRDLKPENLFLAVSRRADVPFTIKVLDFGIAKIVAETTSTTQIIGTPLYMAPEQFEGRGIRPATDVWALGLIAFFLLTGRVYWKTARAPEASVSSIVLQITRDPIEPASTRAAAFGCTVPPGFDAWFSRAVQRDPALRFPDATVACAELALSLAGGVDPLASTMMAPQAPGPVQPTRPLTSPGAFEVVTAPVQRRSKAPRWLFMSTAVAFVVTVVVVVTTRAFAPQQRTPPPSPAPSLEPGYLSIECDPACNSIVVGGAKLGGSPLVRSPLAPGEHQVLLEAPISDEPRGVLRKTIPVSIVSGQTVAMRVLLRTDSRPAQGSPGCSPPYVIGTDGVKRMKPGCP